MKIIDGVFKFRDARQFRGHRDAKIRIHAILKGSYFKGDRRGFFFEPQFCISK